MSKLDALKISHENQNTFKKNSKYFMKVKTLTKILTLNKSQNNQNT